MQNMRKYDAVIFDLDGVICSTDEYHYLAWKELADSLSLPFDRQYNNPPSSCEDESCRRE